MHSSAFDSPRFFRAATAAILGAFLGVAWSGARPSDFGRMHDDTIYFSTAKALAEGRGNVLASVPGEPPQTKYPIFYPLALSGVWRLWPEFPENLHGAMALNLLFAGGLVLAAAVLLRQLGAGRREAALLTAVFAFHPYTLYWSTQLMSDALFGALGVGATVLAHRALSGGRRSFGLMAAATAALWAASATRSLGAAFAVGVAAFAWTREAKLFAAAALSACLPTAALALGKLGGGWPDAGALDGYEQTLLYYTSYGGFWKLAVPDWATFQAQLERMALETLKYPAVLCFLLPAAGFAPPALQGFAVAASAGILNGVRERLRGAGMHPIHWAALAYLPLTLVWNYALMTRFWLPFAPLLLAGAAFELRRVGGAVRRSLHGAAPLADRAVSAVFAGALACLLAYAGWQYAWGLRADFHAGRSARAAAVADRLAAYRWLADHAAPGDRVVSYEDAALYLYAGLQGMRPMIFSTAAVFLQDEAILEHDLERLGDVARAIGADYWLVAEDDYSNESATDQIQAAADRLLEDAPVAFESGGVRIHDLQVRKLRTKYFE